MANIPIPRIVYGSTTLTFSLPPVNKPGADDLEAQRNDSISLSGLKQSVYWRTDTFKNLEMAAVPQADLPAWRDFMAYAITGGEFSYYPDATLAGFTVYTLEDKNWKPTRAYFGHAKFTLRFRRVIGPDQTGS